MTPFGIARNIIGFLGVMFVCVFGRTNIKTRDAGNGLSTCQWMNKMPPNRQTVGTLPAFSSKKRSKIRTARSANIVFLLTRILRKTAFSLGGSESLPIMMAICSSAIWCGQGNRRLRSTSTALLNNLQQHQQQKRIGKDDAQTHRRHTHTHSCANYL